MGIKIYFYKINESVYDVLSGTPVSTNIFTFDFLYEGNAYVAVIDVQNEIKDCIFIRDMNEKAFTKENLILCLYTPDKYIFNKTEQNIKVSNKKRAHIISWPTNNLGHTLDINFDGILTPFIEKIENNGTARNN